MKKHYLFLLAMLLGFIPAKSQLVINEFSQGPSGFGNSDAEWMEFVVKGTRHCSDSTADLRGWIIDDNNNKLFGMGGIGTAAGFVSFSADTLWQHVPYGSIILVYNSSNRDPQITLPDDPTDSNHDHVYIIPVNNTSLFDNHTTTDTVYPTTPFTFGGNWAGLALNNNGDAVITVSPDSLNRYYDAVSYGTGSGGYAHLTQTGSNTSYHLIDSNWNTQGGWTSTTNTAATPGRPNTVADSLWIQSMLSQSSAVIRHTLPIGICQGQSYTFNGHNYTTSTVDSQLYHTPGGCDSEVVLNLTVSPTPATPTIIVNSNPICALSTLLLTANTSTPGVTYTWSNANGFGGPGPGLMIYNIPTSLSGEYYITTTLNGCSSKDSINIVVIPLPNITTAIGANPTICNGSNGRIKLSGLTNGATYTVNYSKNGTAQPALILTATSADTVVIPNLTAGTYSNITVVTAASCMSNSVGPVTLSDPNPPAAPTIGGDTSVCFNTTLHLTGSSATTGVTYSWTGPNNFSSASQNPTRLMSTYADSGNYILTITLNGCTNTASGHVSLIAPPANPLPSSNSPLCAGSSIALSAVGCPQCHL